MSTIPKIWYSFLSTPPEEDHISYYDSKCFDWVKIVEDNWGVIAGEVLAFLEKNKIKPYFNESLVTNKKSWKTSAFFFWNWIFLKNSKQCPQTIRILKNIPGIVSASISILESDITIKPHRGDTNTIIRGHLPIKIPHELPICGFQVNDEQRSWVEGKILLFNDSAKHSAWNHSNKRRVVLIIDIMRPEFKKRKYSISSMVLSGLIIQVIVQKVPFVKFFSKKILYMILKFNAYILFLLLKTQNFIFKK